MVSVKRQAKNKNPKKLKAPKNAALTKTLKKKKRRQKVEIIPQTDEHYGVENFTLSDHKKQLEELAEKDPEFYKFLKEQDADLLQFDESEESESDEKLEEADENAGPEEEEDEGLRRDSTGRKIIDLNFVTNLQNSLLRKDRPEPDAVRQAVTAFTACVARVGADIEPPNYVINDGRIFESTVRLCFTYLGKSLYALLGPKIKSEIDAEAADYSKLSKSKKHTKKQFRRWRKYSSLVKTYCHALSQFLNEVQTPSVVVCTVRAVIDLLDLFVCFPKLTRNITKALIRIWSRRTDECRCVAFMGLCKLIRIHKNSYATVIKWCYLGYVTNVRDVNADSWPLIIFMQKSFAELCMIYPEIAYQYTFVYIRQTAIHLRNAMIAKRKDLIQTVYNWQFVQCLYLWAQVISKAHRHHATTKSTNAAGIEELAYPLCQIITSTMKLFPSLKYFPLRLHCIRILFILQQNCQMYIPTLALAVELLGDALLILKKKPMKGKGTLKGVNVKCLLKVSTAHLQDAGFRQAALEELFKINLEAAYIVQPSCAFPDIFNPINHEIKAFVKNCRSIEFARLFKSLESILKQQTTYARGILNSVDLDLKNQAFMRHLERRLRASDAPLAKFYDSWQKVWKLKADAIGLTDTKSMQPTTSEPGTAVPETAELKPTIEAIAPEVKKCTNVKQPTKELGKSTSIGDSNEDIVEDLILSDAES